MTGLLLRRFLPVILYVAAAALVYRMVYSDGRSDGRAEMANKINQDNEEAGDAAEKRRADLRRCVGAGGVFNFETGACNH
ncbi:hypothetical protein [Nitratireductor soli]|uniref:hypothetical protein n=1 Tax=Nitratireductor soli TaxID=1670619 RepID=UPI000AD5C075|nr:hypothetical protein [Nitratireductor soli]